ncbi:MAG: RNA-binding protein [Gammaproteobacteria bacterium]|nr:RNA-binding protein [Gammaproteobacteria bacterium]MCP5201903.1 RNA-binding protein [Gammaproteobacteria bacterium]
MTLYIACVGSSFRLGELLRWLGEHGEVASLDEPGGGGAKHGVHGAFVRMPNPAEARAAIMALRGRCRDGCRFFVMPVAGRASRSTCPPPAAGAPCAPPRPTVPTIQPGQLP